MPCLSDHNKCGCECRVFWWDDAAWHDATRSVPSRHDANWHAPRHAASYAVCAFRPGGHALRPDAPEPYEPFAGLVWRSLCTDGVFAAADAVHGHAAAPGHGAAALPWSTDAW